MKSLLYVFASYCVVISSCSKSELDPSSEGMWGGNFVSTTNSEAERNFFAFYSEPYDGVLLLQENHPLNANSSSSVNFNGNFFDITVSECQIPDFINSTTQHANGNFSFSSSSGNLASDPFGNEVEFVAANHFAAKLYVPQRIYASVNGSTIGPGTIINWNVDPSNYKGVVIRVSYNSNMQLDETIAKEENIQWLAYTDDNGSFTLDAALFKGIPEGALVGLSVVRGNYAMTISQNGEHNCRIIAHTSAYSSRTFSTN